MEQKYCIAGVKVQMDSFGRTVTQAEPYLADFDGEPEMIIHSDWRSLQERNPHLSDEDCEYLATGGSFYRQLLNFDGMMLHSSGVVMDGKAYVFSAPCGTGKSTHTSLWCKTFGDRACILNDDKPALRLEDGKWYAYGTPWSGKTDLNVNMRVPLGGICFIGRAKENRIEPFGGSKAVFAAIEQTARPVNPEMRAKMLDLVSRLISDVPVWRLYCNMEPEAAILSFETMSKAYKG